MKISTDYRTTQNFRGFRQKLNVFNPISHYADSYLARAADSSQELFEILIPEVKNSVKRINLDAGKNSNLIIWDINSEKSDKYILFLHGMAQNVSNYQSLYKTIIQKGLGVLALEFRGYGDSSRLKVTENSMLKDIETAYKYLTEERKIAPKNIVLMGHSMGGALASNFASKHKEINSLVLISPIPNLRYIGKKFLTNKRKGLGVPEKMAKFAERIKLWNWLSGLRFNCIGSMKKISVPVYIVQSANDSIVPASSTQIIADEAKKRNVLRMYKKIPLGGHNVDAKKTTAVSEVLDIIEL